MLVEKPFSALTVVLFRSGAKIHPQKINRLFVTSFFCGNLTTG